MTIIAEKITDSIGSHSPRCLTIRTTSPKFIHQETLRHRMIYIEDALRGDPDFSFSVSSARAIPFRKLVDEVRSDHIRAAPVKWGAEQKGMSPGDELDDTNKCVFWPDVWGVFKIGQASTAEWITERECVKRLWSVGAEFSALVAQVMSEHNAHKSIANRIIEPYIHVHCLMTGVEAGWMNFFGLRLDKAADPTLQALAEACWVEWNESEPDKLEPGEWHLPYIDDDDPWNAYLLLSGGIKPTDVSRNLSYSSHENWPQVLDILKKVSAAHCARLSYQSFDTGKRSTIEEDLNLFNRLVGGPVLHASPCEHQCTPDQWYDLVHMGASNWGHPELHGNLHGWVQHRKLLSGEAIAPLPEGYASNV
jgi:thymidylate synthase ThyX